MNGWILKERNIKIPDGGCTAFYEAVIQSLLACKVLDGKKNLTMGSLFSGIGGFEFVFTQCGCTPLWASEIEEFCIAVTKKHFGDEENGIKGDLDKFL